MFILAESSSNAKKIGKNNMPYDTYFTRSQLREGYKKVTYFPWWMLMNRATIMTDTVENGLLAPTFGTGSKKLHPIVFSHGLMAEFVSYTA